MTPYQKAQIVSKYELIQKALARNSHCKAKAARELQMDRKTIYNIIEKYNSMQE